MKLIDVLVMISKGELKEGTIIKITDKFFTHTYTYKEGCLVDEYNAPLEEELDIQLMLNYEVEIIDHSPDVGKMVKIEELDIDSTIWNDLYIDQKTDVLFDKLNEVIRELNRRAE